MIDLLITPAAKYVSGRAHVFQPFAAINLAQADTNTQTLNSPPSALTHTGAHFAHSDKDSKFAAREITPAAAAAAAAPLCCYWVRAIKQRAARWQSIRSILHWRVQLGGRALISIRQAGRRRHYHPAAQR